MQTEVANKIKYRKYANDEFYTPNELAVSLITIVPQNPGDVWLDNAPGEGAFYKNFPEGVKPIKCRDFFGVEPDSCDWAVTNPPYSKLNDWFKHSLVTCRKGFAYLLGFHNITPRRIEMCEEAGFGLTTVHLCKVFKWFGISAFCVFEKGKKSVLNYDRKVWHSEGE